jgi:hypothetical protein
MSLSPPLPSPSCGPLRQRVVCVCLYGGGRALIAEERTDLDWLPPFGSCPRPADPGISARGGGGGGERVREKDHRSDDDGLHHHHVDRHHREQLLEDEKECTGKSVNGYITYLICISVISVISVINVTSEIMEVKCNNVYNNVIRVLFYNYK